MVVKVFDRGPGVFVRYGRDIIQFLDFALGAVAEHTAEFEDMARDKIPGMKVAADLGYTQQVCYIVDFVSGGNFISERRGNASERKGMRGLDIDVRQALLHESFLGFGPHRAVEGQIQDPGTGLLPFGILNEHGRFTAPGNGIDLDISRA